MIDKKIQHGGEINHQKLTIREIEILGLIMQGFTNNLKYRRNFLSVTKPSNLHRKNILEKTGS